MQQEWFEMQDVRRRKLNNAVWIPLRASLTMAEQGEIGYRGYRQEFFGAGSLAVPVQQKAAAETLTWSDVGSGLNHGYVIREGKYFPADVFTGDRRELNAVPLVLAQNGNPDDPEEWHLHQDLVIALGLKREGDSWLAMNEGYVEVARLRRNGGSPIILEFRTEHLKDYLCAREMALYVSSYRDREEIVVDANHIKWSGGTAEQVSECDRWEGHLIEIHEGGFAFGSTAAILHVGRDEMDSEEDVPAISPADSNIVSRSWTIKREGEKLVWIKGELWRHEWILPADKSPRVGGHELPPTVFFATDATGTRESGKSLKASGSWLWFSPEVMMGLARRRGGSIQWYTRDTGGVRCSPGTFTLFGVNKLGLVNAYAKDIGHLPEWQQKLWSGFNVSPEGGVGEELLASQARGTPADTQAPEALLPDALKLLNEISEEKLGFRLFRGHEQFESLLRAAHRFRAIDQPALFSLSKDLARLTLERIDKSALQKMVARPKNEDWGSLKTLENVLASLGENDARSLLSPFAAINGLRQADAHLTSSEIEKSFSLIGVDQASPFVAQGQQLLQSCVSALHSIARALAKIPKTAG